MDEAHGFWWYELMTTDVERAQGFYSQVIGLRAEDVSQPGAPYVLFKADDTQVAGLMQIPGHAAAGGATPAWVGYIESPDVDEGAKRLAGAGGTVHREATDIPGVGRFAAVADPHGAHFVLFTPAPGAASPVQQGTPGHIGWHELMAGDLESDFAFYSGLFGWTTAQEIPMGPMGVYRLFSTGGGGPAGGMMTKPAQVAHPHWRFAFQVQSVHAAAPRITSGGGQLVNGPMEVPGGQWTLQATDPQGAFFSLLSNER